jgi:predicted amidohydrolase YtcJ
MIAARYVALVVALFVTAGRASTSVVAPPDLILHNGNIVTVDAAFSHAEAVAVRDGRFVAVGSNTDVRRLAGPDSRLIDLAGRTVVPGLADNHLHGAGGGPGVDLSRTRSLSELFAAIAERVKRAHPGEVVVTNSDWHEAQLREQRLPLRRDLDSVAPDHPVVVVRGGHEYILNSAALRKWNITEKTPAPNGGRISRYLDGTLNGELVDAAKSLVMLPAAPTRTLEDRIRDRVAEYQKLHAAGLTSIRHPGISADDYGLLQEMKRQGLLTMRISVLLRPGNDAGVSPDEGDEWLRIVGVKLGVDGGFEAGLMRQKYAGEFGEGGAFRGLQTVPTAKYIETVKTLNRRGWRIATHAVGDAAIDLVLQAYEAADMEKPIRGRRWTIEHAFIARAEHFPLMKTLGLAVSAQNHLYLAGPSLVKYWGPERAARTTPMRAMLDAGVPVSIGTDSPVVPHPPLRAIYHFVTRDTIAGGVLGADQKISRKEALRANTIGNAWLTFEEGSKGSIEPGKLADLVVLSDDIMTCPEKRIEQMHVEMTMVGGRVVYERPRS